MRSSSSFASCRSPLTFWALWIPMPMNTRNSRLMTLSISTLLEAAKGKGMTPARMRTMSTMPMMPTARKRRQWSGHPPADPSFFDRGSRKLWSARRLRAPPGQLFLHVIWQNIVRWVSGSPPRGCGDKHPILAAFLIKFQGAVIRPQIS